MEILKTTKTIKQLAEEAYAVQDACNLSGVVHAFSRAMTDLWAHAHNESKGTEWVNTHPITILFADKVAHLTGTQDIGNDAVMRAYTDVRKLIEETEATNVPVG